MERRATIKGYAEATGRDGGPNHQPLGQRTYNNTSNVEEDHFRLCLGPSLHYGVNGLKNVFNRVLIRQTSHGKFR